VVPNCGQLCYPLAREQSLATRRQPNF